MASARLLKVGHPLVRRIDRSVFLRSFIPDCMQHACKCSDENDRQRNDACCQHGADVYPIDKEAILRRSREVASVLPPERQDPMAWFDEREAVFDPDPPSGLVIRTATQDLEDESSGCVFLRHDGPRGCGLHRAAMLHGFSPADIKPVVCRLYPFHSTTANWASARILNGTRVPTGRAPASTSSCVRRFWRCSIWIS